MVVLVALASALVARWIRPGSRLAPVLCVAAVVAELLLEAPRWQMWPAYALCAGVVLEAWVRLRRRVAESTPRRRSPWIVIPVGIALCGVYVVALTTPLLFPVFRLPPPTGTHGIGTTYLHLVDEAREEAFAPESGVHRELLVQVWYPAAPEAGAVPEPFCREAAEWSAAWSGAKGYTWLPMIWSHLRLVRSNSYLDAPAAHGAGRFPVLVFSHGYWQSWKAHTGLMEELSSHGYVVVSIVRPYETPYTISAEGSVRTFDWSHPRTRRIVAEQAASSHVAIVDAVAGPQSWRSVRPLVRAFYEAQPTWEESNAAWTQDISFVVDELERSDGHVFSDLVDLTRVAAFGFSLGGRAAALAALTDDRIRAGVNIDGWQTGHLLERDLGVPFLFINSEASRGANDFFFDRAEGPVLDATFRGARHASFHDMALAAPIPGRIAGRLGELGPERGLALLRAHVLAFFDEYLKGDVSPLFAAGSAGHPEVELRSRNR